MGLTLFLFCGTKVLECYADYVRIIFESRKIFLIFVANIECAMPLFLCSVKLKKQ